VYLIWVAGSVKCNKSCRFAFHKGIQGTWKYNSTHSSPRHQTEASIQRHSSTSNPLYPFYRTLNSPERRYGRFVAMSSYFECALLIIVNVSSPVYAIKAYMGSRGGTRWRWVVNAPADLHPRKEPRYPSNRRLGVPRRQVGEEKNILPLPELEPRTFNLLLPNNC